MKKDVVEFIVIVSFELAVIALVMVLHRIGYFNAVADLIKAVFNEG